MEWMIIVLICIKMKFNPVLWHQNSSNVPVDLDFEFKDYQINEFLERILSSNWTNDNQSTDEFDWTYHAMGEISFII